MSHISLGIGSRLKHPEFGEGVVVQVRPESYTITFMQHGMREVKRTFDQFEIIDANDMENDLVSLFDIQETLVGILEKFSDIQQRVDIAPKWKGGKIVMHPADTSLKPLEIPMEKFFNKIIMLRDRLRVLEQRVNAHEQLSDEDKINMQQYITRCYGSLTTFNVLFKYTTDSFIGEKTGKD